MEGLHRVAHLGDVLRYRPQDHGVIDGEYSEPVNAGASNGTCALGVATMRLTASRLRDAQPSTSLMPSQVNPNRPV